MAERKCEAPIHALDCSGEGITRDHFTPKAIAKEFGWSPREVGSEENLQYLSPQCHRDKDRSTPRRLNLLRRQLNKNTEVKFGDHQKLVEE
jgi:hypothetical protein